MPHGFLHFIFLFFSVWCLHKWFSPPLQPTCIRISSTFPHWVILDFSAGLNCYFNWYVGGLFHIFTCFPSNLSKSYFFKWNQWPSVSFLTVKLRKLCKSHLWACPCWEEWTCEGCVSDWVDLSLFNEFTTSVRAEAEFPYWNAVMSGCSSQADDYVIMNGYVLIVMWFLSCLGLFLTCIIWWSKCLFH